MIVYTTNDFRYLYLSTGYDYSPTCVGSKKFNDSTDNELAASDRENINPDITESLQM